MNRTYASILAASLVAFAANAALAADASAPKTREQVKAELAEAIRTGEIVNTESGQKMNEMFPSWYPAKPVTPVTQGKTREQVQSELTEAIRNGTMPVNTGA